MLSLYSVSVQTRQELIVSGYDGFGDGGDAGKQVVTMATERESATDGCYIHIRIVTNRGPAKTGASISL